MSKLDELYKDVDYLEVEFYKHPNSWVTTKEKLGPDHFAVSVTDGKFSKVTVVPTKEYYRRLLIG